MRPAWLAGAASATALGAVWMFAAALRAHAALHSHERPRADLWLGPALAATPAALASGRQLFIGSCAHCHGTDATGDEGPDLHGLQTSDRYIARMILEGEPHEMPSFAKKLGRKEVREITVYLRSLR